MRKQWVILPVFAKETADPAMVPAVSLYQLFSKYFSITFISNSYAVTGIEK